MKDKSRPSRLLELPSDILESNEKLSELKG